MPKSKLNLIKTNSDQIAWDKSLDKVRAEANKRKEDPSLDPIRNVWAYANWVFQQIKGNKSLVAECQDFINSDEDNQLWKAIRHYAFTTKREMTEEQKYDYIFNAYNDYKEKHEGKPPACRRKLLEFVNSYAPALGSSMLGGSSTRGGLVGFGGQREERPKGPIVFGVDYPGSENDPDPLNDKKAIVVIPDKNEAPKDTKLDNQGNLVAATQNAQQAAIESEKFDDKLDGPIGDLLVDVLDSTGKSMGDLQKMDAEELEDLFRQYLKSIPNPEQQTQQQAPTQQLTESLDQSQMEIGRVWEEEILDEEKDSPIKKARRILAIKHKQKKSIEKIEGKKYILNQNEIVKMMSRYGYKYDKKYKKWAKKRSPTYDARRILSDKYQDSLAVKKNDDGTYTIDQDEVRKRMHAHNYFYDLDKKRWNQKYDQLEQPKVEPPVEKKYVPPETKSIIQPKPMDVQKEPTEEKPDFKPDEPKKEEPREDKPVNPVYSLENKDKIKEMEARFILGVANGNTEFTDFNKNEETGEYIPEVSKDEVINKISLLKYDWHDNKYLWLNENNTLPDQLHRLNESQKTILARAFLAAIGKVKEIKVKQGNVPSVEIEDLEDDMEKEDMYYDAQAERWKVIQEDDKELDENVWYSDINESEFEGELMCESYTPEEPIYEAYKRENLITPKQTYNLSDIKNAQGRLLLRALQIPDIKKKIPTPDWKIKWEPLLVGGALDPVADKSKMSSRQVSQELELAGYKFNNDKNFPMWTSSGTQVPGILKMTPDEYIARGILGSKNIPAIRYLIGGSFEPELDKQDILHTMDSGRTPHTWNDEYGWLENDRSEIDQLPTKDEAAQQQRISKLGNADFSTLSKEDQKAFKEVKARNIMSDYMKKSYNDMSSGEKKKAMKKVKLNYEFANGQWRKLSRPNRSWTRSFVGVLGNIMKWGATKLWSKFPSLKDIGGVAQSLSNK